jgi:hypothetical protein
VVAPDPDKVAVCPEQMAGELTVTDGEGFTTTVAIIVFVQPVPIEPTKV